MKWSKLQNSRQRRRNQANLHLWRMDLTLTVGSLWDSSAPLTRFWRASRSWITVSCWAFMFWIRSHWPEQAGVTARKVRRSCTPRRWSPSRAQWRIRNRWLMTTRESAFTQNTLSPSILPEINTIPVSIFQKECTCSWCETYLTIMLFFPFRFGGIPAKHRDENLLIFLGIIDILQSYRQAPSTHPPPLTAQKTDSSTFSLHAPHSQTWSAPWWHLWA